jgi:hypothetical protein
MILIKSHELSESSSLASVLLPTVGEGWMKFPE